MKKSLIIKYCAISILPFFSTAFAQSDAPDFQKEEQFHEIYKNYNEKPTDEQTWSTTLSKQTSQTYLIQKGDTLWDISETLFGDPYFWPKIWALNHKEIFNPHQITQGLAVHFYPGSTSEAPSVHVDSSTSSEQNNESIQPRPLAEKNDNKPLGKAEIPPPQKMPLPVAKLPPSLPKTFNVKVEEPKTVFKIEKRNFFVSKANIDLKYFVTDAPVEPLGRVAEIEGGLGGAAQYQYVVVKIDNPDKKNYTVIKELEDVADRTEEGESKNAKRYEIQGEISILEKVNSEENFYRAMVTKSNSMISVNSILKEGPIKKFDTEYSSVENSPIHAQIIGGQFMYKSDLFSQDAFVYLNKGSQSGLKVGQVIRAYNNPKIRNSESVENQNNKEIAIIKIVDASDSFATGYVIQSVGDLHAGDYIGPKNSLQ